MPSPYLALDLGTSSVKAVVFDRNGRVAWEKATGAEATGLIGVGTEIAPEELWRKTCLLVRAATSAVGPMGAVGVTGQLSLVLLDEDRNPSTHLVTWSDQRAKAEALELSQSLGPSARAATGRSVTAELTAPRLLWFREHRPEVYARTVTVLTLKDFVVERLTGNVVTDATSASYTMLYDVGHRRWSNELLEACALPAQLMPPVLEAGALAGTVSKEAASSTGLSVGVPVAVGGPDGTLGAAGAGAVEAGITVDVAGTTDTIMRSVSFPPAERGSAMVNAFIGPELWTVGGPTGMTGGAMAWIAGLAGASSVREFYRIWDDRIEAVPPGADGLVFVTTLTGERFPSWRGDREGAIAGLRPSHTVAHLARAAEEGAACLVAAGLASLAEIGLASEEVRLVGGASSLARAVRVRADIFGIPVVLMENKEASALGAAMAAAVASNGWSGWPEAGGKMVRALARVVPDPSTAACAKETLARWSGAWRDEAPLTVSDAVMTSQR